MKHCAVKFFYALILVVITGAAYGQKASNWVQEEETGCKDMNPKEDMPIKSARATYDIDAALGLFII